MHVLHFLNDSRPSKPSSRTCGKKRAAWLPTYLANPSTDSEETDPPCHRATLHLCSLEVIVGRKVFIATACSASVRQPLIQIRDRGSAQEAQACSLQVGSAADTLRTAVPLTKLGKWRPFRRRSADWLSDSTSSCAMLFLQLAEPHTGFTPQ